MAKDFIPTNDAGLLAWSANFSGRISGAAGSVGLTPAQAAGYAGLHAAYAGAMAVVADPGNRTRGAVAAKDAARGALKGAARELARIVNAFPAITNAQRADLGLTVRSGRYTTVPRPAEAPVMEVVAAKGQGGRGGRVLKVKLRAPHAASSGKPAGVAGASVFSFVGAAPPADVPAAWTFQGSTTRATLDVRLAPTVPAGARVWLTAFWFNPRRLRGPASTPVSAYVAGGVGPAAARAA